MEGRNVTDLLSLQPGVLYLGQQTTTQADQDSRSGSVAGARSDQTNVTLDGLDDNDQQNGYAFTGVLRSTLDSTEEFRVTTTSSNADAGRSSGAQVTLVTKSGTNQFHGAAYEYNRTSLGYANDWFNKQGELESGLPNRPGKLIRNTFGASLGGPIWKNKLFFFFNYEGQRTAEDQQVTQTVPSLNYRQGIITYQYCVDPNDPTCAQTANSIVEPDADRDPRCTVHRLRSMHNPWAEFSGTGGLPAISRAERSHRRGRIQPAVLHLCLAVSGFAEYHHPQTRL